MATQRKRNSSQLSHVSPSGDARMVDVTAKPPLVRTAIARGTIHLQRKTIRLIEQQAIAKGNVLAAAKLAGIQAAKRTGELIPLCHPLPLTFCDLEFEIPKSKDAIHIQATARITAGTGVEMEALTAVSVAALTLYDMCKAVDQKMSIDSIRLVSKTKSPILH